MYPGILVQVSGPSRGHFTELARAAAGPGTAGPSLTVTSPGPFHLVGPGPDWGFRVWASKGHGCPASQHPDQKFKFILVASESAT